MTERNNNAGEAPMSRWRYEKVIIEAMGLGMLTEESGGIALRLCRTVTWRAKEDAVFTRIGIWWPRYKVAESHGLDRERLDLALSELEHLGFVELADIGAVLPTYPPNTDAIAETFRNRIRRLNGWEVA